MKCGAFNHICRFEDIWALEKYIDVFNPWRNWDHTNLNKDKYKWENVVFGKK